MIAAVRGVTAASTAAGSRQKLSGSMSANTGVAPVSATALAVAAKRERRHDHLVARPDAERQQAEVQGAGARVDRDARAGRRPVRRELLLERRDLGPCASMPGAQHARRPRRAPRSPIMRLAARDHRGADVVELIWRSRATTPSCLARSGRPASAQRHVASAVRSAAATPARPTQPTRRAGTPTTSAKSGTSSTTTAPAATIAQRPIVTGATHTERAPSEAPSWTVTPTGVPVGGALRACRPGRPTAGTGRW